MKTKLLLFLFFISFLSYSQEKTVNIDSTQITLIGNKLYKGHQEYIKNKEGALSTKIRYTEIDLSNVLFKTSKSVLLPVSYNSLNALVIILRDNPQIVLKIEGHTDKIGHSRSNLKLSIRRARAIRLYLFSKGIKLDRITAKGYGDQFPICKAPCQQNQRVEFILIHDGTEQKLITRKVE